jgi:CrcB protein
MGKLLLVGFGGFIGSVLRYGAGSWVYRMKAGWSFPLETLLINVAGCLLIGFLAGWSETRGVLAESTRAFLFIGLLGGFTTYSAFGHETFQLLRGARWPEAATSVALQLVLGIGAVWVGGALARRA